MLLTERCLGPPSRGSWAESQNCVHARIRHSSNHFNGADADPRHIGIDGCDISPEIDTAAQGGSRTAPLQGDGAETTGLNQSGIDIEAQTYGKRPPPRCGLPPWRNGVEAPDSNWPGIDTAAQDGSRSSPPRGGVAETMTHGIDTAAQDGSRSAPPRGGGAETIAGCDAVEHTCRYNLRKRPCAAAHRTSVEAGIDTAT